MRALLVLVVFSLALPSWSVAQDSPGAAEVAVFRGRPLEAGALAGIGPLNRAWLEAARLPALERARAQLALANAHPELRERALLAVAGALVTARVLASDVPGLCPGDDDDSELEDASLARVEAEMGPMIGKLERLHEQLRQTGACADVIAEGGWMLRALRRAGDPARAMHVPSGGELRVPAPRRHALELRWFRAPTPRSGVHRFLARRFDRSLSDRRPERTVRVPAGGEAAVVGVPGPGTWVLELRETGSGWQQMRPVVVSDLGFDCIALGSHVVVGAYLGEKPAGGATVSLHSGSGQLIAEGTCDAHGVVTLAVPLAYLENSATDDARVEVRSGEHVARAALHDIGRPLSLCEGVRAHAFCERPLYRPGETVRGRIFVRRIEAFAGEPQGRPVRGGGYRLRLWPGEKDEQTLRGTVNARGVLTFETRIPRTAAHGRVAAALDIGSEQIRLRRLFRVDPFRRSPLLVELRGPTRLAPGVGGEARLQARWSHGAPAAGSPVSVHARIGSLEQELETRLGPDGELRIQLPRDEAFFEGRRWPLHLRAVVRGPDGQGVTGRCKILLPEEPTKPATSHGTPRFVGPKTALRPGAEARFRLRFRPNSRGLCVLWLHDRVLTRAVNFDAAGLAEPAFNIPSDACGLTRIVFVGDGYDTARSFRIAGPANILKIALETRRRSYLPGGRCRVALRVTDGDGKPARAILCASVVDERILALEEVDDIAAADRFGRLWWSWRRRDASDHPVARPWRLIGEMLAGGRPFGEPTAWPYNGPAGSVPPSGLAALGVPEDLLRKRFRPAVGYRAFLRTDESGRASYEFELPDDLTTWRLRVVAVDEGMGQGAARFRLVTEKPLSVEAALPRFLRLGDRIHTTPAVFGAAPDEVEWAVGSGDELAVERRPSLAEGVSLRARSRGEARFELAVRAGRASDALRRVLPVRRNTVRESLGTGGTVTKTWREFTLPEADELDTLVIGAGRAALLAGLRTGLAKYPYRCAEQTSSRLLGLFGRKVPAQAVAALDAEAMFARLGRLWHPDRLLYSWWPGQPGDRGITALVLHTLCELQAAGHPLARYGLDVKDSSYRVRAVIRAAEARQDDGCAFDIAAVEHMVALLRLRSESKPLREAVEKLLRTPSADVQSGLPRGLLARAGLALIEAGRRAHALEIARALRGPERARMPGLWLGELDRVQLAFELRLRQELGLADAATREIEEALLGHIESRGFQHTWSAACALHALSRSTDQDKLPAAIGVELRIDGRPRAITLDEEGRHRTRLALEGNPRLAIRSPSGAEIRVRLTGAKHVAAATFAAKGRGLTVERFILGAEASSPLQRGRVYRLALAIRANRDARYLVVRCPLPAGCEVQGRPSGIERHDDAVIATIRHLVAGRSQRIEVPVVFGFEGSVQWPPVHVHDMYGGSCFAYSAGSRLRVEADVGPRAEASSQGRAEVAVLTASWRLVRNDDLLERALRAEFPNTARRLLQRIEDQRLALTRAQCAKWFEPLFARHGGDDCFWFRRELFDLPGAPETPAEPKTALDYAMAFHRDAADLAMRRRLLEVPDALLLRLLVELAADTEAAIKNGIEEALRIGSIRHEAVTRCPPTLAAELALAEALFARVEGDSVVLNESAVEALEELSELELSARHGAAEGPVEAGIRARLGTLRKRAAALRARHVPPEALDPQEKLEQDIEEARWRDIPRAKWPVELDELSREDVEAFVALGEDGIRYMVAQANRSAEILDEKHWLETLAAGAVVDLAVLTPLLGDPWPDEPGRTFLPGAPIRRVPSRQLAAACRRDATPSLRVLYLRELARRAELFPLRPDHPAERPYHLVWNSLLGDRGSREALARLLMAEEAPGEFVAAAWPALLPDPGYPVFERMLGEMTDHEHLVSFSSLTPAERRRALEAYDDEALPPALSDALLRELRDVLWAWILADPNGYEHLVDHFVRSEYGLSLLRAQLAIRHVSNPTIARWLLFERGISLPFRGGSGLLLRLDASDRRTRERLAERWLDGELAVPAREIPRDALRRILRRRGCSLK